MKNPSVKFLLIGTLTVFQMSSMFLRSVFAQGTFTAVQLRGTVQDASQAGVPNATVTATNDATGVSVAATTDDQGRYTFNALHVGTYTLKVEVAGFKTVLRPNIVLRVGQQTDLDFTLEVGEVTSTIEVTAAAPLLDSVTGTLGAVVDNKYVTAVPLFDREISRLSYLAPGVTQTQGQAFSNNAGGLNFSSNGQRSATAQVRLDGGIVSTPDGTGDGNNTFVAQPSPEFVQEFKVQNNGLSAEYGSNGGTVINIITKSGTNEFHGSGFYFGRRPYFDANNFFANRAGQEKADYGRDNYGGSLGGPIIKQKTFFFFDYERTRFNSPGTTSLTLPTAAEKRGDFSQTFNADGSLVRIFNPFEVDPVTLDRTPFSGNIIPPSMFDPVAVKALSYLPDPESPGDPVTGFNNFVRNTTSLSKSYKYDIKIDHNFTPTMRISARNSQYNNAFEPTILFGNEADSTSFGNSGNRTGIVEYSWTLNPKTVWTSHVSFTHFSNNYNGAEFDPTTLGFPASLAEAGGVSRFPRIEPADYAGIGLNGWANQVEGHTLYGIGSSISKVVGAHNFKFGGEQRIFFANYYSPGFPVGGFYFNRQATEKNVFGFKSDEGNSIASLLLGWGSSGQLDIQPASATKSKDTGFYFQDDWKVSQRLTLNMGLRYEWTTPFTERYDRLQFLSPSFDTGIDVAGLGRMRGAALYATPDQRTVPADRNNIGPRFGFAYRLSEKTVLRSGAGVYYGLNLLSSTWLIDSSSRKTASWRPSTDGGITRYATLANPFPDGNLQPQGRKYGNLNQWGLPVSGALPEKGNRNPELYMWNVSLQHQFTKDFLIEVAYSGNRGTHNPFTGTHNQNLIPKEARERYGTAGLLEQVPNPFQPLFAGPDAIFNEPDSIYNNPTLPRGNLLRTYPQFDYQVGGDFWVNSFSTHDLLAASNSRYNSIMFRFEKRYSHGLNFAGHYTYSRYMDNSGASLAWHGNGAPLQDRHNLAAEWSADGSDTPHRFVLGWSYELPVGRGKALGSQMNPVVDKVVGGWQINGYLTLQSGFPIPVEMYVGRLADGFQRPNLNGNPRSNVSIQDVVDRKGLYIDTSVFSDPGDQIPGNSLHYLSNLREPRINQLDLSIFKIFPFREEMQLQLRAEFFNFTNTPRFGVGGTYFEGTYNDINYGSQTFGQINRQRNDPRQFQMGIRFLF